MKANLIVIALCLGFRVYAQPSNPSVRSGTVTVTPGVNQTLITQQSGKAIVNWGDFSIPGGHTVNIQQPGASAALLNRVTGGNPSNLLGTLNANGKVYLVNPNGIVVGNGARINAAAFIASALDVSDSDFLAGGDLLFSGSSTAGVVNMGSITAANGDVILIGRQVSNQGSISSPNGVTALAAGGRVLYSPQGDQRILIESEIELEGEGEGTGVGAENQGVIEAAQAEIKAAGGNVYDLAVNQAGIIRATGVENRNGRILLTSDRGSITHAGELSARNADGSGGEILIGGDFQGGNPEVSNAATTYVTETARIVVGAVTPEGSGGLAIVWADQKTSFHGTIDGRAGALGGDGAFAEVSGKQMLYFQGSADLRAPSGRTGELLLDPVSLEITTAANSNLDRTSGNPHRFEPTTGSMTSILFVTTLEGQLALSDVIIDTSNRGPKPGEIDFSAPPPAVPVEYGDGTIVVNSPIQWNSGNRLNFNSGNNIEINADINGGSTGDIIFGLGQIEPVFPNTYYSLAPVTSELIVAPSATVTGNTVTVQHANPQMLFGGINSVDFQGVLNANVLDINYQVDAASQYAGFQGAVSFSNPNNAIGILRGDTNAGRLLADFTVIDGSGGLTVENEFVADFGAEIRIITTGDLTLAPGAILSTGGWQNILSGQDSDIYLAARGGNFINQAGLNAVNPQGTGRFLIFASNPADNTPDGLTGDPVYNKTYDGNDPSTLTQTGDRFVYSLAPTLTLTANPASKTQGDPNPTFGFTPSGLVSGDAAADVFSGTPVLSTPATVSSPAGTYDIDIATGSVALSDFDYLINLVAGVLTIDPGPIQELLITANNAVKTFGENNPAFTALFSIPAAEADITGLQFDVSALNTSSVGNYTITPFGASGTGYNISYAPGTLTINPRLLTIGAQNASKVYGDLAPTFTPTFDNLASFHSRADMGPLVLTSAATAQFVDVGSYAITPSGAVNTNYILSYSPGTASVTPRPATLTGIDDSREYGEANPLLFATPSGFVNNDYNRANLTISTSATATSNVGGYAITPTAYNDDNYSVNFVDGTLSVTPAPLLLTADDATRVYGDNNPAFSFSGSGFKNGEDESVVQNPVFSTLAVPESTVGDYVLNITGADPGNYSLNLTPGTLTVNPRQLFLLVNNASRVFGDPNPAFTVSNVGFDSIVNGDNVAAMLDLQTVVPSPANTGPGFYVIRNNAGVDPRRYSLDGLIPGVLTVAPRPITLTVDDAGALLEGVTNFSNPERFASLPYTVSATNLVPGFSLRQVFPELSFRTFSGRTEVEVAASDYRQQITPPFFNDPALSSGYAPLTAATATETVSIATSPTSGFFADGKMGIVPDGYTGSSLYVVTAIVPYIASPPLIEIPNAIVLNADGTLPPITFELSEPSEEMQKVIEAMNNQKPLVVRSMTDYTSNIGVFFEDYPVIAFDIVEHYLNGLLGDASEEHLALFRAIFGDGPVRPPFDMGLIQSWLADVSTNMEKRAVMGGAMLGYLQDLQGRTEFSFEEQRFTEVIAAKVGEKRREFAEMLLERKENYENFPTAAKQLDRARYGLKETEKKAAKAALAHLEKFGEDLTGDEITLLQNIVASVYSLSDAEIDYGSLLMETNLEGLEAKMVRYEILSNKSGLISSAAAIAAGGTAGVSGFGIGATTTIGSIIFVAEKGSFIAAGTVGAKAVAVAIGPAVVAAAAAGVTTWGAIQLVQQGEQKHIFEDLVQGGTGVLSFSEIDFSPQAEIVTKNPKPQDLANELFKHMLVESLDEMILGL